MDRFVAVPAGAPASKFDLEVIVSEDGAIAVDALIIGAAPASPPV